MKPLFIPLKTEYYRAFEAGTKTCEYRPYGPRWNERTCLVGRLAVLSRGYSTPDRIERVILGFRRVKMEDLSVATCVAFMAIYGIECNDIAEIEVSS